jgi:hypothetical protein
LVAPRVNIMLLFIVEPLIKLYCDNHGFIMLGFSLVF